MPRLQDSRLQSWWLLLSNLWGQITILYCLPACTLSIIQRGCFILDSTYSPTHRFGVWELRLQLLNLLLWPLTSPSSISLLVATGCCVASCLETTKQPSASRQGWYSSSIHAKPHHEPTISLSPSYFSSLQFERPYIILINFDFFWFSERYLHKLLWMMQLFSRVAMANLGKGIKLDFTIS